MTQNSENDLEKKALNRFKIKRISWKSIAAGIIILIAGIMIGVEGTTVVYEIILHRLVENPEKYSQHFKNHLIENLDLSAEQSKQVNAIIDARVNKLIEIKKATLTQVNEQLDLMENEIASILDKKQNKRLHRKFEKFRSHMPEK